MIDPLMTSTPIQSKTLNYDIDNNSVQKENLTSSSPVYLNLEQVFNQYPLKKDSIIVSIYAIIQCYNSEKGILTVMDETRQNFVIKFIKSNVFSKLQDNDNSMTDSKKIPTRCGDIIRIDRLFLYEDLTRKCNIIEDVVIFEAFKNEIFSPFSIEKNIELTDQDRNRVIELTNFNVSLLLESKIRQITTKNYCLVNSAFQVLCKLKYENRIILACYNGDDLIENYPCMQLIKCKQIIDTLNNFNNDKENDTKSNVYSEEFIKKIYDEHKIVFISVYGIHRVVATITKPLDFIIVYNLTIKSDNAYYASHTFLLNYSFNYGCCIRLADDNSELAIALKAQIEIKCLFEETSFNQQQDDTNRFNHSKRYFQIINNTNNDTINEEQNQSLIKRKKQNDKNSFSLSNTLDDSLIVSDIHTIHCTHHEYTKNQKEFIHRHFYSRKDYNPSSFIRLKSFIELTEHCQKNENNVYLIDAKFHSLSFEIEDSFNPFESISTLRKYCCFVSCNNENKCKYYDSFESFFQKSSEWIMEKENQQLSYRIEESSSSNNDLSTKVMNKLKCPNCNLENLDLFLDFIIILQDYDDNLILTRLTGNDANLFFNCSTNDLCQGSSSSSSLLLLKKILSFFKHAFHLTNEKTECLQKITWTIKFSQERQTYCLIDVAIMNYHISCGISISNMN